MPKLTDEQLMRLIDAGATDEEILALSQEAEAAPESSGWGTAALAGGAALAAGLVAKKLGLGGVAGKVFDTANNMRRQGMLTGMAIPKSLVGNLGAGVTTAIEEGSVAPLKEMLRLPTNVKNAVQAFKQGGQYQGQPMSKWALPGRILGATDEAATAALGRAGIPAEAAAKTMLQSEADLGFLREPLNTKLGQYLVPFRRTPFNQLAGGFETMSDWSTKGKAAANAAALGTGFLTGEETEGVVPTGLGAAFFGRRGLPFAAGSMLGKLAKGETKREAAKVMQGASPVSDYSLIEGIQGPAEGNFGQKPAILRLLGLDK